MVRSCHLLAVFYKPSIGHHHHFSHNLFFFSFLRSGVLSYRLHTCARRHCVPPHKAKCFTQSRLSKQLSKIQTTNILVRPIWWATAYRPYYPSIILDDAQNDDDLGIRSPVLIPVSLDHDDGDPLRHCLYPPTTRPTDGRSGLPGWRPSEHLPGDDPSTRHPSPETGILAVFHHS